VSRRGPDWRQIGPRCGRIGARVSPVEGRNAAGKRQHCGDYVAELGPDWGKNASAQSSFRFIEIARVLTSDRNKLLEATNQGTCLNQLSLRQSLVLAQVSPDLAEASGNLFAQLMALHSEVDAPISEEHFEPAEKAAGAERFFERSKRAFLENRTTTSTETGMLHPQRRELDGDGEIRNLVNKKVSKQGAVNAVCAILQGDPTSYVTSRPTLAMCTKGYAGPPTPSKIRMYRALATRAGAHSSRP
jgi:hypothetical protein